MEASVQDVSSSEQGSTCGAPTKPPTTERKRDYLCDLTLLVKDGKQFRAHRDLLSEASPFFEKLLQSGMMESKEGVVRLEVLTEAVMEDILQFIYTGDVQISTRERAEDLITAADYLSVLSLRTVSVRFLQRHLTTANCISTHFLAETYHCEELLIDSTKFIHKNIVSVSKSEEFLNLERHDIERWISSDDIAVTAEEDVFDMILRWIDQDKSHRIGEFNELFRHLRLVFISHDYLSRHVVTNQLVKENVGCQNLVFDAMNRIDSANNDDILRRPRKCLEVDALVFYGEGAAWINFPDADVTDPDEWIHSRDFLPANCDVVSCLGRLYAFKCEDIFEAYVYDPFLNKSKLRWAQPPNLFLSVVDRFLVIREEIHVIMSDDMESINNSLYRYDILSDSWEIISSFHLNEEACVVVEDKYVYALGGISSTHECVAEAKRLDTSGKKWEMIRELSQPRRSAFGVAAHGMVFVAGGWGYTHVWGGMLETCEVYNNLTNEWNFVGSLCCPRGRGSMVCVGETLYVLGGEGRYRFIEYSYVGKDGALRFNKLGTKLPGHMNYWTVYKGFSTKLFKPMVDKL